MSNFLWHFVTVIVFALLLASLVVGWFPLIKWFPVIGEWVRTAQLVALLACLALGLIGGYRYADNHAKLKSLQTKLDAAKLDLSTAEDAAAMAHQENIELQMKDQENAERIKQYEQSLKARPNANCTLTPDDFKRMRKR